MASRSGVHESGPALRIRECRDTDREAIVGLWEAAGLTRPWNDPNRDLERKLTDSPWGMLVGELVVEAPPSPSASSPASPSPAAPRIVACVMVGYDGHRGSVNYLAVDPELRGRGIGSALMDHAEALLLRRGCPKINLSVRADNAAVGRFYTARGYQLESADHAVAYGLRLIPDTPPNPQRSA